MGRQFLRFVSSSRVVFAAASTLLAGNLAAEEEQFHRNEAALVLGGTYESEEESNFFTIGIEYGFRVNPRISVGGTVEHLSALDAWLVIIPVTFHIYEELAAFGGPGWELEPRRSGEGESHAAGTGDEILFLGRVGLQYGFELGSRYTVFPSVAFDFVNRGEGVSSAFVYVVKLAISF